MTDMTDSQARICQRLEDSVVTTVLESMELKLLIAGVKHLREDKQLLTGYDARNIQSMERQSSPEES